MPGSDRLKCLIIDDDPTISDLLKHFCAKLEDIEYCIACNNAVDGLKLLSQQKFDLLFLDYNMPDLDGKAILDIKSDDSRVIMITSRSDFAVDSYEYESIVDYIVKPVKFERFVKSIERYKSMQKSQEEDQLHYFVKDGSRWLKIELADVEFIKSDSNYVVWQTGQKQVLELQNLKDLENKLPSNFIRIHRSYIINTKKIYSLSKEEVFIGKHRIPVGQNYKDRLEKIIH